MNYISEVPLYNKSEVEDSVNLVVEICPGTADKSELIEPTFSMLQVVRQVVGKYPFYYGSFPQTYAGDKDPLDFILFTDKKHNQLDLVKADVIGAVRTVDAGEQDDKIICVECDCSLMNVRKQFKQALKFLKTYKGKNADMKIDKKLASMAEAEKLVADAHNAWSERNKRAQIRKNNLKTATKKLIAGAQQININAESSVKVIRR